MISVRDAGAGAGTDRSGPRDWAVLLAGACLLVISNGRWIVPLAAWLFPILLLRFARRVHGAAAYLGLYAAIAGASAAMWWGMAPLRGAPYAGFIAATALALAAPFWLAAWLARRRDDFVATLLLPSAWVSSEFLVSLASPFATWGAMAYSQRGNLALMQLLSVTGIWGITFLIGWVAAVVNWAWDRPWPETRRGVLACVAVLAAVLLGGEARLAFLPPAGPTIRTASITVPWPEDARRIWRTLSQTLPAEEMQRIRADTVRLHDRLFAASEDQARGGTAIVFWAEINGLVFKEDEAPLVARGQDLARRHGIYLAMALGVFTPGQPVMENRLVTVDPAGQIVSSYDKATRVPGDRQADGHRAIPVLATPQGRLAVAICFDMDFPRLVRRRPGSQADVVIVPAKDWRAIREMHATMAVCRGIENGMSVVRQTYQGVSLAADYQGRVLAWVDDHESPGPALTAYVPARGTATVYSVVGDALGWIAVGVSAASCLRARRSRPRS